MLATSKLFSQCLSSHACGSSFEIFLSANNISYPWLCKLQQISTHAFCSWVDKFSQERNGGSPNNLRKRSKTTPFDVQYLCSREVQDCLMQPVYTLILIQMNVRNFSVHENKSCYSHRDKGNRLTRRVSQINVYAVKRVFQQSSKLKIAECLIVHVMSSSYYVTKFELGYEWKATEQRRFCVSHNNLLYKVSVNHE